MKTAQVEKNKIIIKEVESLKLNGRKGAIVKVLGCGLCGSDIVKFRHKIAKDGTVLGHEIVGIIEEIDSETSFKIGDKTQFKEKMYRFLKYCDIDRDLDDFWTIHDKKIKKWYLNQQKNDDVIISASPEFLLCPLEKSFNFNVIGSKVDKFNGKYSGTNCYYEEKVVRFKEAYPKGTIDGFYSDHYSDEPLAVIANKAYIVNGDSIYEWDFNKHIKPRV